MVNAIGINNEYGKKHNGYNYSFASKINEESIFLEETLQNIEDEQGILGKTWNGIKELTTLGVSQSDCEDMLRKYRIGEISFEEAINYLEEYDSKQETMSSLLSNILTGAGSIAIATAAVATGGWAALGAKGIASLAAKSITWSSAFLYGAPVGAVLKTTINGIDRATNNIEDDTLNGKQIVKDAVSGAITGATSAVSSGMGATIKAGKFGETALKGALCGVECGALSGSTSYMTDVAFGDKEFNFGDLATNTLTSAAVSGTVGAAVGAGMFKVSNPTGAILSNNSKTVAQTVAQDSSTSSLRKVLGSGTKKALNIA